MIYLWFHVFRSMEASRRGRERLWALGRRRTQNELNREKTTASCMLRMTSTNKLFGWCFSSLRSALISAVRRAPSSTLKMRKYFRYKISHQFSLARARAHTHSIHSKDVSKCIWSKDGFDVLPYESNRSGKCSVAQRMNYVGDGLAYDLLLTKESDRQRDLWQLCSVQLSKIILLKF